MSLPADGTREMIERLSGLYQKDPEEFERLSRQLIHQTIEGFPEHRRSRARGLQFKLDCILSRYHDPVARMNKMVEIFWDYFQQFHEAFFNPEKLLAEREARTSGEAKVIPLFEAPNSSRRKPDRDLN